MPDVERTITVPVSIDKVWPYMYDFSNNTYWDPAAEKTERRSGDGGVGTVYHNISEIMGHETELDYTVEEVDHEMRLVLRGENETVTAVDTMTFSGDESSTTLTYHADFTLKGAAKLATPLAPAGLKKLGDETAAQIEKCLCEL